MRIVKNIYTNMEEIKNIMQKVSVTFEMWVSTPFYELKHIQDDVKAIADKLTKDEVYVAVYALNTVYYMKDQKFNNIMSIRNVGKKRRELYMNAYNDLNFGNVKVLVEDN